MRKNKSLTAAFTLGKLQHYNLSKRCHFSGLFLVISLTLLLEPKPGTNVVERHFWVRGRVQG